MGTDELSRRGFVAGVVGTSAAAAAADTAAAQQEVPDFDGSYLSDARLYDAPQVDDLRGEDSPTVSVGAGDAGLAFGPPTIWIDPGTTITWEWTGEGGAHNVNNYEGPAALDSGDPVSDAGNTYQYEFSEEDAGITHYRCIPHEPQGMKGAIAVGDDVPTVSVEEDGGPSIEIPSIAYAIAALVFATIASIIGLGYFLDKFGGDYEE